MNTVLKLFLSMSFSGALLILILLIGKQILKDKISRQWQYYIWLIVILRLLLPFGAQINLLGKTYQTIDRTIIQTSPDDLQDIHAPVIDVDVDHQNGKQPTIVPAAEYSFQDRMTLFLNYIWLIWLAGVLGISFFSVLADCMSEEALNLWLDRALEDEDFAFQSVVFQKLEMYDESDELEKELEKEQLAQYQAVGVTKNGKNYYYKGQLVNIFLDTRPNKSFYTLNMNPAGIVNIRILRGEDGQITGVAYMTETEAAELLGDMGDAEEEDGRTQGQDITIPVEIDSVKSGEYIYLGTYSLNEDNRVSYHISAETGQQLIVGFIKPGQEQKRSNTYYNTVGTTVQNGVLEIDSDDIVWSVKSGEYRLFVHAEGGALTGVTGEVTIRN